MILSYKEGDKQTMSKMIVCQRVINAVRKEEKKSRIKGGGGNGGVRAWEQVLYYLSWCELDLSVTCCLLLASKSMGHFKYL